MKDSRLIVSTVVILALGAFLFAQHQNIGDLEREIARLKKEAQARDENVAQTSAAAEQLRKKATTLEAVNSQLEARNKAVAGDPAAAASVAEGGVEGTDAKGKEGFGKMMQKMFTDPDMKKMIQSQQSMVVKMMYGDLAKELGLPADKASRVMDLLAERQMAIAGKGMKMLGGEKADAASTEAVGQEVKSAKDEFDVQLEDLLGKDGMTRLSDYERTMGERMQLQQYQQAFNASGAALNDQQSQGLLGIMKEERMKQPPSPLDPGKADVGAAMKALQSDDTFDTLMASQEDMNRRVLSRARNVLTPDQMVQFETIQKQQLDMQKMGMKMGREMMKAK